jgi:hypothetical protein
MTPPSTLAKGEDSARSRAASKAPARHSGRARSQPSALRLSPATALASLALLTACEREPDLPPLPPASLDRSQSEAMQRMNTAGVTAFAGWTWRYEFGAGCRMRVIKRYTGRPIPVIEYVLLDHYVEIVPYPGSGFGVKAYSRAKAGSADLFDARSEAQAAAFAKDVERLTATCGAAAPTAR